MQPTTCERRHTRSIGHVTDRCWRTASYRYDTQNADIR